MTGGHDHDVESLLKGEARARLPLARQILLYLDAFALFMDASQGPHGRHRPRLPRRAHGHGAHRRGLSLAGRPA